MNKSVVIIGAGIAGISAAAHLGRLGYSVDVYEKNSTPGGRARVFREQGYTFDMGPSWYWMPDVIDHFFSQFDKSIENYIDLVRLDPSFTIIRSDSDVMEVPADFEKLCALFEKMESGAAKKLRSFMNAAETKYNVGMLDMAYKQGDSLVEFINVKSLRAFFQLDLFTNFRKYVKKYFKDPRIIQLMEFPILFLGAPPQKTPALYSLMNYAGLKLGTFYPKGGFNKLVEAMKSVAEQEGVKFHFNSTVTRINTKSELVSSIELPGAEVPVDHLIAAGDYHHMETLLQDATKKNYPAAYWNKRTFAPSCLIFYLGVKKKIPRLDHHNLFFDKDFDKHTDAIYREKKWPQDPLFYTCCPSKTDNTLAPPGHENLFVLIPVASGLKDEPETRKFYLNYIINRLERYTKTEMRKNIQFSRSYCIDDFIEDYNACQGNAYGLANSLNQTAILKPKIKNRKLKNMYYAGQLTVPGPGLPPAIISGQIAAQLLFDNSKKINEKAI